MPADMFRSAPPARRRASLIPVSIAVHAVALSALVIAPILADGDLPEPARAMPIYVEVKVPTLPPLPPRHDPAPPRTSPTPSSNPDAAPLVMPDRITPERVESDVQSEPSLEEVGFGRTGVVGTVPGAVVSNYLPAPPTPRGPVRISDGIRAPRKIKDVPPRYPVLAQQARVQGTVIVEAVIGVDGRVKETRVLQSVSLLDHAALEAVNQWVFSPTLLNGEPVPVVMTVTVEFRLR